VSIRSVDDIADSGVTVGLVGFMTMHAGTCRLTAEYEISSVPQHSTYKYGTYLYLHYFCALPTHRKIDRSA